MNRHAFGLFLLPLLVFTCTLVSFAEDEAKDKVKNRYDVPDGSVTELVKFLDNLMAYRPKTTDEILVYRQKAQKALTAAADKILELEKDKSSDAHRKAGSVKLQLDLPKLQRGQPADQKDFYKRLQAHITTAKTLGQNDLALAFTASQLLEQSGNTELAQEAYENFGKMFSTNDDETFADLGRKMTATSRRLGLVGKEMKIEGKTLDGKEFDWKAYRGKVVLVDYWATWCRPCVEELPNVKKNYEKYHAKGFEVVGISLDENRERLTEFVKIKELPWTTLFEDEAGGNHPMAEYYGITSIPSMMLVGRDGKVITLSARGGGLDRQLARLFGEADDAGSE